jgi:hypothetical protein
MNYFRICVCSVWFLCFSKMVSSQDTINFHLVNTVYDSVVLKNPSFEDVPRKGSQFSPPIHGWKDCGQINFPGESPPDIHPVINTAWGVRNAAEKGDTYLGLVIRENATWECVSQHLNTSLKPGACYSFNAYLCLSPVYDSMTKLSQGIVQDFSHPAVLRVWGGSDACERLELLAISPPVANHEWKKCTFLLNPIMACQSITLEAFYYIPESNYSNEKLKAYNGHILIDDLSTIMEIECK